MAITGEIKSLYKDRAQTQAIFPTTKVNAVSDESGTGLNVILDDIKNDYATKAFVSNKIAEIEGSGGTSSGLPAVPDDDKANVWISTVRTLRMGSTGENYNDDAQGELGLGEFGVTEGYVGMGVRKDSTDNTRRYVRLYDSNTYPAISRAVRVIDGCHRNRE